MEVPESEKHVAVCHASRPADSQRHDVLGVSAAQVLECRRTSVQVRKFSPVLWNVGVTLKLLRLRDQTIDGDRDAAFRRIRASDAVERVTRFLFRCRVSAALLPKP